MADDVAKPEKGFVLDTNSFEDPKVIKKLTQGSRPNYVYILLEVREELDRGKSEPGRWGRNARRTIRGLEDLLVEKKVEYDEGKGNLPFVAEENGGRVYFIPRDHPEFRNIQRGDARIDYHFIDATKVLQKMFSDMRMILVSNDRSLRNEAHIEDVPVEFLRTGRVRLDELYTGFHGQFVNHEALDAFIKAKRPVQEMSEALGLTGELIPNQFIQATGAPNSYLQYAMITPDGTGVRRLGAFSKFFDGKTAASEKAQFFDAQFKLPFSPENETVPFYELLTREDLTTVAVTGPAGSGRTINLIYAGLKQVERGRYKRIVLARDMTVTGDTGLGFLPGDLDEKMAPFVAPWRGALFTLFGGDDPRVPASKTAEIRKEIVRLEQEETVMYVPYTYVQGTTISNAFIGIDEAQNLNADQIEMIMGRVGNGSKVVFIGDPAQVGAVHFSGRELSEEDCGIVYLIDSMKHISSPLYGTVTLTKTHRSPTAALARELYNRRMGLTEKGHNLED